MKQGSILNFIKNSKNKEENPSNIPVVESQEIIISTNTEKINIEKTEEKNISENYDQNESLKKLNISKDKTRKKSANKSQLEVSIEANLHSSNFKRNKLIIDDPIEELEIIPENSKEKKIEIPCMINDNTKSNLMIKENKDDKKSVNNNNLDKSILFSIITSTLTKIEGLKGENSKDAIKECFSNLFKDIFDNTPDDLSRLYYFLLSKVGPEYNSPEFGIGNETLVKCVAKATGKSEKNVKEGIHALGDLALVAMEGKKTLGTMEKFSGFVKTAEKKPLTLKKVFDGFVELANIKGKSSFTEKERILMKLLFDATNEEIKFIIRSLQKSLKIGASFKTIIAAMSRCISRIYNNFCKKELTVEEKEVQKSLLIAINQMADYDIIMKKIYECMIKKIQIKELENLCCITPGIPLKPQLARPTTGLNVIFQRFEKIPFTCEFKYDGFRGQIHHYTCRKTGFSKTEIFSRNLENMTESYPDVVKFVDEKIRSEKIESFILDCEIVAFDSKTNKIQPFQVLTTRARKNVNIEEISIKVCMFLFDIIYLNGIPEIHKTLDERRNVLKENFVESDHIKFAKYTNSDNNEEIEGLMNDSLQAGKYIFSNKIIKIKRIV